MRLIRRWRWWLVLAVLVAGAVLGGRWYLSSYLVKARVTAQLEALYGGRIHIDHVALGLKHSVLSGVELFEQGQGPGSMPWLKIDRLEADVALADLVKGRQPTEVRAHGITIALHFDDDGRPITTLPPRPPTSGGSLDTLPAVTLTDVRLLLLGTRGRQMEVANIAATLRSSGTRHVLDATGHSPFCDWKADGWIDLGQKQVAVTVRSDRDITVTQPLLDGLPFVAARTWNEVQLDGATPVVVAFQFDWGKPRQSLAIHLEPKHTAVHVSAIDLTTTDTAGKVDIVDGTIRLGDLHGKGYGGDLAVDGVIDFRGAGVRFDLAKVDLKNLDVHEMPPSWSLPAALRGRLDASGGLDIAISDGKRKIRGTGAGQVRDATLAGQPPAGPIILTLRTTEEAALLTVDGRLPPSELSPLAEALGLDLPPASAGKLALDVQASFPLDTIADRRTFRATARATLEDARFAGLAVNHATSDFLYADDTLSTANFQATLERQGSVKGTASLRLSEPYAFRVHLEPQNVDLALIDRLDESVRPQIHLTGRVGAAFDIAGTLSPWSAASTGKADATDLVVQGWNVARAGIQWHSDKEAWKITAIDATGYGGKVTGTATIPLKGNALGDLQLAFSGVELQGLVHDRFAVPVPVDGKVDGTLRGVLSSDPHDLLLTLEAHSPRILLDHVATEKIAATLRYKQGFLGYRAEGQTLGGTFQLDGDVAMDERMAPSRPQLGHLHLRHIALGRVPEIWDRGAATKNVGGSMDADIDYRHDGADRFPIGKGRAVLSDLAWNSQTFASQIQGEVALDRERLTVQDLSSTLANGAVRGKAVVNLKQPDQSWFKVDLENGDLAEVLQYWPSLAQDLQGSLAIHLRGTMDRQWSGAAEVVLTRGKVMGVEVSEWRVPLRYTFDPAFATGTLDVTDSTATVAQGKLTSQVSVVWTDAMRLRGKVNFVGVDLHQAFPAAKIGKGRATGHAEFSGERVQSIDDLKGTLVASLQQTQALELPVLKQLAPILGLATTATFQSGDVRAHLARGVIHIDRLSFPEGPLQLYAEGQVTLGGRVTMDVTANTGKLANLAAMLGVRLPDTGNIGVDLLKKATAALSPNLVRVHVTGTVHQPNVQVVPLPILTDQALRFFAGMRLQ